MPAQPIETPAEITAAMPDPNAPVPKEESPITQPTVPNDKKPFAVITINAITAPAAGNYPQSLFNYRNAKSSLASRYTQTIAWEPVVDTVFARDTQYTAVLTLTPISGENTFAGTAVSNINGLPSENVSDINLGINGDDLVLRISYEKTAHDDDAALLLFSDEFDGDALDTTKWAVCPNWDRQGRSTWDDSLVTVSDGCLRLGFVRDEALGHSKTNEEKLAVNWIRAGAVRTMKRDNVNMLFENAYGYYEARIKFPKVQGMWGAFWLMSPNIADGAVSGTEIDIVESAESAKNSFNAALHWDGYGDEHKSAGSKDISRLGINIYDGGFHTFALDWSPNAYAFYVDGVEFWCCESGANLKNFGINQNPNYIKLTVEGADWPGPLPEGFSEGEMLVDYVRVYNQPKG
jgi:beta-glucanase (GH16 family)